MKSWALPGRDVDKRDEAVEKRERCAGKAGGWGVGRGMGGSDPVIQRNLCRELSQSKR